MTADRSGRPSSAASAVVLVCCALTSTGWLVLGVLVAVAHESPAVARGLAAAAAEGDDWALGLLTGAPWTEPLSQLVPDMALSVLVLACAGALLVSGARSPAHRLLGIALAASAAAFNLQSTAASQALATATGLGQVDVVPRFVLPVVTCVAYVLAMTSAPGGGPAGRRERWVVVAAAGVAVLAFLSALVFSVSVRCVLLAGLVLPLLGIAGARRQYRAATSEQQRAPARLLFGVLVGTVVVEATVAVVTGMLVWLDFPRLTVIDPTAAGVGMSFPSMPPLVLSLWASHLSLPVLAVAVLWAGRRSGAGTAQRWFSRSLVVVLVTALLGCLYVVTDTLVRRQAPPLVAEGVAVVVCALAFLPVFLMAERVADRLLYGTRPAPYAVLAELATLPRVATRGVPDLACVAEVVGRGLGATTCRLTVHRPGLRDRSYQWVRAAEEEAEALLEVPSRHGGQEVGTIAIDRAAVAGADDQRRDLLEAIANNLGVVLEATRAGIDLERQLRAALAHAAEIANARRRAVAEADSERRRIERDLHDGAQHHLVSLSLALGVVEFEVGAGRLEQARARLDQLLEQLDTAEAVLARTAAGLSAPAVGERGVVAALCAEFAGDPNVRVDVTGGTVPRSSPEVEAAVYFCCLESVNNARKHAAGAPVDLRLATSQERLHFTVRDGGPGWDSGGDSGGQGRGLRNMASRIATVGGRLQVRSAPGQGTTVEGWVPLAAPAPDRPAAVAVSGTGLLEQVGAALRAARDLYHATPYAQPLRELAQRLEQPLRLAVVGPPGPEVPRLTDRLRAFFAPGSISLSAAPGLGSPDPREADHARELVLPGEARLPLADAHVLLLPTSGQAQAFYGAVSGNPRRLRPAQTIGALVVRGDGGDGPPGGAEPPVEARRLCSAIVPIRLPSQPTSDGGPEGDLGPAHLHELIETRFLDRVEALKARTAVTALAGLLRVAPPSGDPRPLAYQLERVRTDWPELAELDLLDALCAGELVVPEAERSAAERLLGLHGTDIRARLGCGPQAGSEEMSDVAWRQLARWRQVAAHPASTAHTRGLALQMVETCERLLLLIPAPRPPSESRSAHPALQ